MNKFVVMVFVTAFMGVYNPQSVFAQGSPYPQSQLITGIVWDFTSHDQRASGSDNWGLTWADDGHQYASIGDGNGFQGTCKTCGTGIARIEGTYDSYTGYDRHGSCNAECSHQLHSLYAFNIFAYNDGVNDRIYGLFHNDNDEGGNLRYSDNKGCTWTNSGWAFTTDGFNGPFGRSLFLNMGQNYGAAKDDYVYIYSAEQGLSAFGLGDYVELARVPKDSITNRNLYEWYTGMNGDTPTWSSNINDRQPILTWPGRVAWIVYPSYNPDLDKYFLAFNTSSSEADIAIFESDNPWGLWYEVAVYDKWGNFGQLHTFSFAPKWWRNNGKDFTIVFSGTGSNDSWNTINGNFILADTNR